MYVNLNQLTLLFFGVDLVLYITDFNSSFLFLLFEFGLLHHSITISMWYVRANRVKKYKVKKDSSLSILTSHMKW